MRLNTRFVVLGAMLVAACGGGSGATGGASGTRNGTNTTAKPAAPPGTMKLGHFSSADGMVHVVVDRTGEKVKIRIDGSTDIVELTTDEVRNRGELMGYAFVAPDGKRMLFVGVGGDLIFIRNDRDELPLVRDGEATALGPATTKGAPPGPKPREKSPNEVLAAEFEPLSVVKRFPQFKPEDAGNLTKVAEAYQLATADMLVHCTELCGAWYAPHPSKDGKGGLGFVRDKDLKQGPATAEEKKGALAKYNAWIRPEYEFGDWTHQVVKSSWLAIFQLEFKTLSAKAPALVWNVDETDVFMVTPEGGRYWDSPTDGNGKARIAKGIAPVAEWPAPLQNNLLFREHIVEMNKRGLIDKKLADEVEGIYAKWGECAQKVFAPAQKDIETNLTGSNPHYSASKRNDLVRRKYNDKAMTECGGARADNLLAQILSQREKDQKALYEKNKTRIASIAK